MIVQKAKGKVTFVLEPPVDGSKVFVAGCFNHWDASADPLRKQKDGTYRKSVDLPPGQYQYRFVVDGQWVTDPKSPGHCPNEFGSLNSTFLVER